MLCEGRREGYTDVMVKHITKYQVFLDSNALRDKDWIKTDLFVKLESLRQENLADVKFYLPGIVQQEWLNHYKTLATQHQSSVQRFHRKLEDMGTEISNLSILSDESFEHAAKSLLAKNRLYIIPTPYERIDWPMLMSRAVSHVIPFEPESDKGIKDAVLAHTIHDYALRHSARRDQQLIVITHDAKLQSYLKEIFVGKELDIYSTLEDFASNLRLVVDKLGADLLTKAKSAFYTREDPTSLYKKEEIYVKLKKTYDDLITEKGTARARVLSLSQDKIKGDYSIPDDEDWEPRDSHLRIIQTSFIGRKGARLQWSTKLSFKQLYTMSTVDKHGYKTTNSLPLAHSVLFNIKWSSRIGHEQRLISRKITSIALVDEKAEIGRFSRENGVGSTPEDSALMRATELKQALDKLLGRNISSTGKTLLQSELATLRALDINGDTSTSGAADD